MSLVEWTFLENTPATASTAISSMPIQGSPSISGVNGILSSPALDEANALSIVGRLTGAANGTLDVTIQTMSDENTWDDQARFPLTLAGVPMMHWKFVMTRGFPSGMTAIGSIGNTDPLVNTPTPLIALGTFINGDWGNKIRLVMIAGSGTTSGAVLKVRIAAQAGSIRRNG